MKVERVAIIGAGNGGLTACADLGDKGFKINLLESEKFCQNLDFIKKQGGLYLYETEEVSNSGENATCAKDSEPKFVGIDLISDNVEEVIKDAQIVMLTIPGIAVEYFARLLSPHLNEEQIVLINSAASMGPIRFFNEARSMGIDKNFKIAETNTLTYGTRGYADEGKVELYLRAKKVFLSAYPCENNQEVFDACNQIYDCFVMAKNILQVNLENGNPEVHPGPALLNAGRIDYSGGEFWLYKEGITEHTINILKAVEKERMELGRALGFEVEDALEGRRNRGYFTNEDKTLRELFNTSPVFTQIKGPTSVTSRYFTEDISMGLVLWSNLGKVLDVPTPNIDAIIVLSSTLLNIDFYKDGLTLEKLNLGNLNKNTVEDIL